MTNKTVTMPLELAKMILSELTSGFVSVRTRAKLRALLAAPAVERQDPVAYRYRLNDRADREWTYGKHSMNDRGLELRYECEPLYTSTPAPVAVVLPAKQFSEVGEDYLQADWVSGWNACLDKVKELNQ